MTIASEITRIQTNIANAYTAASGKGATMPATENSDNLATCIASISGGGSSGKYALLDRVKDDSNNEIGTVSGFFTDANNVEYAVVCLDAQYRLALGTWCSNETTSITNLPILDGYVLYSSTDTSTFNTQKILDFCSANSATSTSCTHCRSNSFTIDNTIYYGQLPNMVEAIDVLRRRIQINAADTSASSYSSLIIPEYTIMWTSAQRGTDKGWCISRTGVIDGRDKTSDSFVVPVLEIPNV